jgi:four helix bundle protein
MNNKSDLILQKADKLAVGVYILSKKLPKEELFGFTSQLRRASLSVVLNIIEGYARQQRQDHRRFLEISFGSTKEVMYLLDFGIKIRYFKDDDVRIISNGYDEVARMLWVKIQTLRKLK